MFAAGIDVYEHEPEVDPRLLAAPRAMLLPHIGSASRRTRTNMATLATSAVATVLAGGTPPNVVSLAAGRTVSTPVPLRPEARSRP